VESVIQLKNELNKFGSELFIFYGDKKKIITSLIKILSCKSVVCGKTYEQDINNLYTEISKLCNVEEVSDSFLTDFNITKKDGKAFKVFTPYKNEFFRQINIEEFSRKFVSKNFKFPKIDYKKFLKLIGGKIPEFIKDANKQNILKIAGFEESPLLEFDTKTGEQKLDDFCKNRAKDYRNNRDIPSVDGTSKLSPYLRYGLISPKKCFAMCYEHKKNKGVNAWLSELIWREFYATTLYHFPEIQNHEFIEKYRKMKWSYDKEKLKAWRNGETGYPIVDAGMRQLKQTGWMHNRVRMIVASFLTKNLFIDWREGEKHFANYLIDYEPASNVGGWQWSASVGIDPQPYFRIFNPYLQSKKFDKNGEYIKRYVPELKNVTPALFHKDINIEGYFKQMVNYKDSRKNALREFKKFK